MNDFLEYLSEALKDIKPGNKKKDEKVKDDYDILYEISQLITNTRKQLKITQKELSLKSGISQSNISKIENGNYVPSLLVLKRIADALGCRILIDFIINSED